jgi:hypothetical protein
MKNSKPKKQQMNSKLIVINNSAVEWTTGEHGTLTPRYTYAPGTMTENDFTPEAGNSLIGGETGTGDNDTYFIFDETVPPVGTVFVIYVNKAGAAESGQFPAVL